MSRGRAVVGILTLGASEVVIFVVRALAFVATFGMSEGVIHSLGNVRRRSSERVVPQWSCGSG